MPLLAVAGLVLAGCSSGVVNSNPVSPAVATTPTQTLITDAPADQVLALGLTVNSIVMTDSAGKSATVLSTPVQIEASHLDAVQEPLLAPLNIPQDTYVSATITVANPVVVYVDTTTGKPVTVSATLAAASTTVTFTSPIKVTSTSTPICFDLLVGQSVSISGTTVTVTPTFNVTQINAVPQPSSPANGKVVGIYGKVVSTNGTTLVIEIPNGLQLTIATNSATVLQGFTQLSALTAGELVDVDLAQLPDGTLLALRIHLITAPAGSLFLGPVTSTTGSPVTSFTQVVRQVLLPTAAAGALTATNTVNVTSATTFGLAPQVGTLPTLPFTPVFSAATLFAGQNVAVTSTAAVTSLTGTTMTANSVTLIPQTIDGTIASIAILGGQTVYTVTLPSDSALAKLTGKTTVYVYVGSGTMILNATPVTATSVVRFNGLLFNDAGTLRMVAVASCDPPAAAPPQMH